MKRLIVILASPLLGALTLYSSESPQGTQTDRLSWQRTDDSLALLQDGRLVWRFNAGTNETKPCFSPVALPGGPALTWYRPQDHPWHRALWFSWKYINGVNYWEEDPRTGLAEGKTQWQRPRFELRPDFSAQLEMELSYRPTNGPTVLAEHRLIEVSPPDATGSYRMDWTMVFTAAGQDAKLDRTPPPGQPNGQSFGGYAGLSVRLVRDLREIRIVTSEGVAQLSEDKFRGKAIGLDYAGLVENREAGIAILDHPANLNSPTPWYAIREKVMHYFSPAVICYQPHTLKAGENMTLRYRLVVHPGHWDAERLRQEAAHFAEKK